jgi:MFS family permease
MSRDLLQATLFGGVLSSLSGALYVSSHSALIADLTPVKSRAMVMSVFTAVNSLAQAPGPISGGFMYERLSPQSPLLASVLAYIPSLLVLLLFVKEPKHKSR